MSSEEKTAATVGKPGRKPGFRLWPTDVAAVVLCALGTWWLVPVAGSMAYVFPVALGHFFLFCNVFRVGRTCEIIWSALFVANVFAWVACDALSWWHVVAAQSPVTLGVIVYTLTRRDYHGVAYQYVLSRKRRDGDGNERP